MTDREGADVSRPGAREMTRGRFVGFALASVFLSSLLVTVLLAGLDLYLHYRHGINVWGYRGPIVGRKAAGETRIVVLGESTAWGYRVRWDEAFPAYLEQDLNAAQGGARGRRVSVVNLAYNNEGAFSFQFTLRDYAYLDPDVALFYTGYNDLGQKVEPGGIQNTQVIRHRSAIFRLTGYWPLIPVMLPRRFPILRALMDDGDRRVTFRPDLAARSGVASGEADAERARTLEAQLGRLTESPGVALTPPPEGCAGTWTAYCRSIRAAIEVALARGTRVVVVTQPYISDRHVTQQRALLGMLRRELGADPRVRHVNLGPLVDLHDPALAYDGMHLTARGNARVAEALVPALLDSLR